MLIFENSISYYNAMIKQAMLYASALWFACSVGYLQRIFCLQKQRTLNILDADTRTNSVELFKKINWLPLHLEVKVVNCIQVYKRINGQNPSYINDLLVLNSAINDRNSRNGSLNFVCPRFKRESKGGRTFSVRAARLWKTIPDSLKKIECVHSFKKAENRSRAEGGQ